MGSSISIDIGICSNFQNGQLSRLYCLDNDGLNFCCQQVNASTLLNDLGARICCSLDEYHEQQWVTLLSIQIYVILLTISFLALIMALIWFYITTFWIKESMVNESREVIIRHLLHKQLLHKSRIHGDSVLSNVKKIRDSLSSSSRQLRNRKIKFVEQSSMTSSQQNNAREEAPNEVTGQVSTPAFILHKRPPIHKHKEVIITSLDPQ